MDITHTSIFIMAREVGLRALERKREEKIKGDNSEGTIIRGLNREMQQQNLC